MDSIEKDLNEIMEYIKDLKEENRKQKEILDILKQHISIAVDTVYNFDTDKDERIEFVVFNGKFVGLNDRDKTTIKGWLDGR